MDEDRMRAILAEEFRSAGMNGAYVEPGMLRAMRRAVEEAVGLAQIKDVPMRDRVAQAIGECIATRHAAVAATLGGSYVGNWALADAAIGAMREATAVMVEAGKAAAGAEGAHDCEVSMADVWRAMIDVALIEVGDRVRGEITNPGPGYYDCIK